MFIVFLYNPFYFCSACSHVFSFISDFWVIWVFSLFLVTVAKGLSTGLIFSKEQHLLICSVFLFFISLIAPVIFVLSLSLRVLGWVCFSFPVCQGRGLFDILLLFKHRFVAINFTPCQWHPMHLGTWCLHFDPRVFLNFSCNFSCDLLII